MSRFFCVSSVSTAFFFFFQIIYGLSILELTIKLVKDKSGYLRKTIGLVLITISLTFSYFAIKDPNPIYHVLFF